MLLSVNSLHATAGLSLLVVLLACSNPAQAQDITLSLGDSDGLAGRVVQLFILVTLLSLVPALGMMFTCFPFMVTVLAILRQGLGLQQSPPNMLIVSLAIFLTYFVMEPVFIEAWDTGVAPAVKGDISLDEALRISVLPFKNFMLLRTDPETLAALAELRVPTGAGVKDDMSILTASFLLSEIERAFQVGFLIFLPFVIIDLVVAAILMSMGMMMVPPVIVSLPFKLAFFVVADGWTLLTKALVSSYF